MADDLQQYLDSLQRDDCYVVDSVMKESELERTERVFFVGSNGGKLGPFVRKTYRLSDGVGVAWWRVMEAQRAGARFVHLPRIVDCYEMGEESAVVMEFVRGETLDGVVRTRGVSLQVAKDLFGGACDAATELHTAFDPPLIHRDIKPSNLMLSGDEVVLIDLGIARTFASDAAVDTARLGTRGFAPPEQFGFGQTDVRSDVYALGMLLFYLLTGQVPEPANVERVLRENGVSQAVRSVVLKAAAFDPASRYAVAEDLKQAFYAAAEVGDGPSPINETQPPAAETSARRKPLSQRFVRVGLVWDILLASASALLLIFCILLCIFPANELAQAAPATRALQLLGIWALLSAPALVLCDPRPLVRILPRLATCGFLKRLVAAIVIAAISFVVVGILGNMQ